MSETTDNQIGEQQAQRGVIVIYHNADYDGIFCREIARKFVPGAQLIGWDYGDEVPEVGVDLDLIILDLAIEALMSHPRLIWIDHHRTSIEKYGHLFDNQVFRQAYVIDGVAACRLSWQYFTGFPAVGEIAGLPDKDSYLTRKVIEPLAVRLAGEYDIWDHRGDGDIEFQFGLDAQTSIDWNLLLRASVDNEPMVRHILHDGLAAKRCIQKRESDVMLARSFVFGWEGLKFLTLNTAKCNSQTFTVRDVEATGHDALMAFFFNGRVWKFSMYHAAHRTDIDLSAIAAKYGGGGHKGACGFETINPGGIGLDLENICKENGHLVRKPCESVASGS